MFRLLIEIPGLRNLTMQTLKMMFSILSKRERVGLVFQFLGMLLNSFLEVFGLAILVPVVNLVAYPEQAVESKWYLKLFIDLFNIRHDDVKLLLIIIVVFIAFVYVFKAAYTVLFSLWTNRFINKFSARLSTALFANYLYQPYEFHVYHNTSDLISRATYDVGSFVGSVSNTIGVISDILFCVVTLIYLLINEWAMTIIIFFGLGAVSVFLNWLFRKKARAYGREAALLNAQSLKAVRQGLAGIKETKISNREQFFIDVYDRTRAQGRELAIKRSVIGIIPRTFVEMMGMLGMLLGLMVYYLLGNPPEQIVNTFTLLALAVVKLLPYVSRISAEVNTFRGTMFSIHRVYEDISLLREVPATADDTTQVAPMAFARGIALEGITFQYKTGIAPVLINASAFIPKGESVAFCGRSGAGKTTTIDILLGLLKPQQGRVLCDDADIASDLRGWHKDISYVPQDIYLIDDSIRANIAFGYARSEINEEMIWSSLEKAQLAEFVRGLPQGLDTVIGEKGVRLSGGQRQRIGIARALYRDTPIIVFDEATSALDYETEGEILKSVEGLRGEKTLIIITHRLNTIENCDRIYQIDETGMHCTKGEA